MDGKERVIKHLEITQGVINRLANNSFLIKAWSLSILAVAILFISRSDSAYSKYLTLAFVVPAIAFWILDGCFLWQERLFRDIYNHVRKQENTDFAMYVPKQSNKPNDNHTWLNAIFSKILIIFYMTEIIFIVLVFLISIFEGCYVTR